MVQFDQEGIPDKAKPPVKRGRKAADFIMRLKMAELPKNKRLASLASLFEEGKEVTL